MTATPTDRSGISSARPLSRSVLDFVTEFSVALHKHTIYPGGHPLVDDAVRTLHERLTALLAERPSLAIGVTPTQLIVGGIASDIGHPVAREFAGKLHRKNVGAVKFVAGAEADEVGHLLGAVAHDAIGEAEQSWPHIRLFPLTYDQLRLDEDDAAADESGSGLWLDLARSALEQEGRAESAALSDPRLVARAIEARRNDPTLDRRVVDYLTEFSAAAREQGGAEALAGQRFVSAMVGSLSGETLRRLLQLKPDGPARRELVLGTAQVVAVDTVIELARAAADVSDHALSPSLIRLFSKLADHAGRGSGPSRAAAAEALRDQVSHLLHGWDVPGTELGTAGEYRRLAAALPAGPAGKGPTTAVGAEPERILEMSLELGCVNAAASNAADSLVAEGRVGRLMELLSASGIDDSGLVALRGRIISVATVAEVVGRRPIDFDALRLLADALWTDAAPPLLDALAGEEDRVIRRRLLELLAGLGPSIGPDVVARLAAPDWYVQRNMLALLNSLPESPAGFSAAPFLRHADARVRHEAVKLLLRDPGTRDRAICDALGASDDRTLRVALSAAAERCPRAAVPLLVCHITDGTLEASLVPLAVRALGQSGAPTALACLIQVVRLRKRLFRRERLAPKSPAMLAALAMLATRWRGSPSVAPVLALARQHADPEIRAAASAAVGAEAAA